MIGLVALGGAVGAVLRYALSNGAAKLFGVTYPYGTFFINIFGSFLMGLLVAYVMRYTPENAGNFRLFIGVGVLGGFTTFSAFSLETALLIQRGETLAAMLYALLSVVLSVIALFAGLALIKGIPA